MIAAAALLALAAVAPESLVVRSGARTTTVPVIVANG